MRTDVIDVRIGQEPAHVFHVFRQRNDVKRRFIRIQGNDRQWFGSGEIKRETHLIPPSKNPFGAQQ